MIRRLSYLLLSLPLIISLGLQLLLPVTALADGFTLGLNYDESNANVKTMINDANACHTNLGPLGCESGAGSGKGGDGWHDSQIIATGGIFGSGTILPYQQVAAGRYYVYGPYDIYCTADGTPSATKPPASQASYDVQISVVGDFTGDFSQNANELYYGAVTQVQYTEAQTNNPATDTDTSWIENSSSSSNLDDAGAGLPITQGQLSDDKEPTSAVDNCLKNAGLPSDWLDFWNNKTNKTFISSNVAHSGDPDLQNLVYEANNQKKDVSSWNSILSKAGGGTVGNPVATSGQFSGVSSGTGTSAAPTISCTVSGFSILNPLNWLLCGAVQGMSDIIGFADSAITSQLAVGTGGASSDQPIQIFCKGYTGTSTSGTSLNESDTTSDAGCQAYHSAWTQFRDIALGLMALVGLTALIAQALGFEFLDAYTIRKVIPRLLIAVIAITLSWQLMALFVQFSNDLGYGVRALIYFPFTSGGFNSVGINLTGLGANGASLLAGLGGLALGFFGLLALAASGALALLIAFFVLVLRQIAIIMLIILAPIGILAYVLPNTQNIFKLWWDSFSKALLMFPLIVAMIATGHVFAAIAAHTAQETNSTLYYFAAFVAYFAPYFLIPATFKLAGGAVRQIGGFVNDRGKGGFDRLRQARNKTVQDRMHRAAQGNLYRASNPLARGINTAARGIATAPTAGTTPWKMRSRFQAGMSTRKLDAMAEYMEKNSDFKAISGNDDYLQATMKSAGGGNTEDDWRRYLSSQGYSGANLEQGVAKIRAAKRGVSDDVFKQAAVVANASTGTGWKETGAGGMYAAINEAAGDDRGTAVAMLAQMRGRASQERRQDLAGASINKQIGWMNDMNDGNMSAQDATRVTARRAWETNSAGSIVQQRGDSVKQMVPVIMDEVRSAYASGNEVAIDRSLAKMADLQDVMNYASPEVKEILTDGIFAQPTGADQAMPVYERYDKDEYKLDAGGNRLPALTQEGRQMRAADGSAVFQMHRRGEVKLDASGNGVPARDIDGQPKVNYVNFRNEIEKRQRSRPEEHPEFFNSRREQQMRGSDDDLRSMGEGGLTPPTGPPI